MKPLYIFDMGGVVAANVDVIPDVLNALSMSRPDFQMYAGGDWEDLMTGRITSEYFWKSFARKTGVVVREDLFASFFKPRLIPGTIEIIRRLERTCRVVCGTNTFDSHYRIHEGRNDYSIFHAVYASHIMGLAKPDIRFYTYILSDESMNPEQAVFIDDHERNILGAKTLGIEAYQFSTPEQLAADLGI